MLEVFSVFICSLILGIAGLFSIKKIINNKENINSIYTYILILLLAFIPTLFYNVEYQAIYSVVTIFLMIIVYKNIFKLNLYETLIAVCIFYLFMYISELINYLIYIRFVDLKAIRAGIIVKILLNLTTSITILIITSITKPNRLYKLLERKQNVFEGIFVTLLIIALIFYAYNLTTIKSLDLKSLANIIPVIAFLLLLLIFYKEKTNYNKLESNYDSLFNYVQTFEDWVEKEQLNRHEYKNQLAVIRSITANKKVHKKIDEILNENINVEDSIINELKYLPNGGLKGLLYYKAIVATKKGVIFTINVSLKSKKINKLSNENIKTLCKLLGIYLDNAIEASAEASTKRILLEIYNIKDEINIVISNTFNNKIDIEKIHTKGFSTKGKNRGNGLYFAQKLVSKSKNINTSQKIIDDYYIQTIKIEN